MSAKVVTEGLDMKGTTASSECSPSEKARNNKRLRDIDIAKGIAILAVIVGHVSIRLSGFSRGAFFIMASCFTFHMPLFFLLSGYFLHYDRAVDLRKEVKRLVVPYACTVVAILALQILATLVLGDCPKGMTYGDFILGWINAALYGSASITGKELWPQQFRIGAIWFLLALFWARILVSLAYKNRFPGVIVICLTILGAISARYVWLPFSIQAGLAASLFVYLGTVARRCNLLQKLTSHWLVVVISAFVWLCAIVFFNGFGMGLADYGSSPSDVFRNIVGSIAAIITVVSISGFLDRHACHISTLLEQIGRLSLLILAVHIIDDDVTRIDAINLFLLGSGMGAFWITVLESIVRCTYTVLLARCLMRLRFIRDIFS